MREVLLKALLGAVLLALLTPAGASTREEQRIGDAADVLDQLQRIPEKGVPPTLLARAYAVAVIPNVRKAGIGIGARRGKGILVVRRDDGAWSNPAFIKMTGGSIGWQIGAQSTDVILVFKSRRGVDDFAGGKITLGADVSVAAGPVGRHAEVATDLQFKAEVVSYSRSRGLFAGVALEGAGLAFDQNANTAFYGSASMTPETIFSSSADSAPAIANRFVELLTSQTRDLPTSPGMQVDAPPQAEPRGEEPSNVRTFSMPDSDDDN